MGSITTFPETQVPAPNRPVTLGYVQVTANQTGITAEVDLAGLSVTVTVPEGRRLRITGEINAFADVVPTVGDLKIWEDGVQLTGGAEVMTVANASNKINTSIVRTPAAGTHTYKLRLFRASGSGTITMTAGGVWPAYILVEDITGMPQPYPAASVPVGLLAQSAYNLSLTGFAGSPVAPVDVPGSVLNVTVPAGRTLRVSATGRLGSNVTSGHIVGDIIMDGGIIGRFNNSDVGAGLTIQAMNAVLVSPSAGAHTFKLQVYKYNGGNTADLGMAQIWIEDITPTPAPANSAPSSTLGYAERTSNQGSIVGSTDLTGLSVTVTVPAGRRLRIKGRTIMLSTVASDEIQCRIMEDGVLKFTHAAISNATNGGVTFLPEVILTPTAGTHTYKLNAVRSTGSGTITSYGNANDPAYLLVEDITSVSTYAINPLSVMPGVFQAGDYTIPGQLFLKGAGNALWLEERDLVGGNWAIYASALKFRINAFGTDVFMIDRKSAGSVQSVRSLWPVAAGADEAPLSTNWKFSALSVIGGRGESVFKKIGAMSATNPMWIWRHSESGAHLQLWSDDGVGAVSYIEFDNNINYIQLNQHVSLNLKELRFYAWNNSDHKLVYRSTAPGGSGDGPCLFGYNKGHLCTTQGGENWSLAWDNAGHIWSRGSFNGNLRATWVEGPGGSGAANLRSKSGGNAIRFDWSGGFQMWVDVTHVKTFVIDHPLDSERHLVHACVEGPENVVFYRGQAQLEDGWVEIELPAYFEALCAKEGRSVQLTCIADDAADEWCPVLHATYPRNGKFHVGLGSGMMIRDQRFWWEVKAVRKDVAPLLVEPTKDSIEVMGDGPYTYYRER